MSRDRLDPDELALLEDERDDLLASIEDLDAELAAGDIDPADHRELRDDYTARAAAVLEAIGNRRRLAEDRRPPPTSRTRTLVVTSVVVIAALGAGVLVARSAGQRGDGPITGAVDTARAELATCQESSFRDPEAGVECYDAILEDSPDNVEALTYRGWALVRSDRVQEGAADLARAVEVDPDYPDARAFRAVVAARGGDLELAAREIDRFYRSDPSPAAVSVLQSQGIEREVFLGTISDASRRCWQEAAQGQDPDDTDAGAFLEDLGACLGGVLASDPGDVDALVSAAYASVGPDTDDLSAAAALAERAVAADPSDPNAVLLRATIALAQGRIDVAAADLARLEELPRPTASFLLGGPEELRRAIEDAEAGAGVAGSAGARPTGPGSAPDDTAPGGTAPGDTAPGDTAPGDTAPDDGVDPRIPNPSGG